MLSTLIGYLGFLIAAYAVIANDVIQTLGTFLSSNQKRPWWVLWIFAAGLLCLTLWYGWFAYEGDVSYGRLSSIPLPPQLPIWFLLGPLVLLVITRFGIPVSTTFMILSLFSTGAFIEKMLLKSVYGYVVAFFSAILLYGLAARFFESRKSIRKLEHSKDQHYWVIAQWGSTAFLWSQWLIQDFANIFVFLPRQLDAGTLIGCTLVLIGIMAYLFRQRGGKIQKIVNQKSNSGNIRSATVIDLCYGLMLYVYGNLNAIPMSTTWAFIGILAGREIAIHFWLKRRSMSSAYILVAKDLAKVNIGLAVSILVAYLLQFLKF